MEKRMICGRDVAVFIDRKQLLQAETAQLRVSAELHKVRSCFCSEDVAHVEKKREYKLHLTGVRFRKPFENFNFYDLDNFTTRLCIDGTTYVLEGCMWDDYQAVTDKERFREHISITAVRMKREEENNEGNTEQ